MRVYVCEDHIHAAPQHFKDFSALQQKFHNWGIGGIERAAHRQAAECRSNAWNLVLYACQTRKTPKLCASFSQIDNPWERPVDARRPSAIIPRDGNLLN